VFRDTHIWGHSSALPLVVGMEALYRCWLAIPKGCHSEGRVRVRFSSTVQNGGPESYHMDPVVEP